MSLVSFVIISENEATPDAARALRQLSIPFEHEILIAVGANPSRQRNLAAARARGEYLYFLDDDAMLSQSTVDTVASRLRCAESLVLGGPSELPQDASSFERAVERVLSNQIVFGSLAKRYSSVDGKGRCNPDVLLLCNALISRRDFLTVGGLDERLYPNEENELWKRLSSANVPFFYDPHIRITRRHRANLSAVLKQFFRYGAGRGRHVFRPFAWREVLYLGPSMLVFAALFGIVAGYGSLVFACFLLLACLGLTPSELRSPLILPVVFAGYGIGLLWGTLMPQPVARRVDTPVVIELYG